MFNDRKVVDFADFHIEGVANRNSAKELSVILMTHINVDDIIFPDNTLELKYPSTVGTGGAEKGWHLATISQQRCLLASHFASFANKHYNSCYLALPEYYCLQNLLNDLTEEYGLASEIVDEQIKLLEVVIKEFKQDYMRVDPGFIFTILKQ